jgi:hypothetical protein
MAVPVRPTIPDALAFVSLMLVAGTSACFTPSVSGSFVALVSKRATGGPATATATGDWSLLVTVPDPGQ